MLVFHILLTLLLVAVFVFDVSRYLIPNWLVGLILLLYPVFYFAAPEPLDWVGALIAFGAIFAVGFTMFALRWVGGGDVKLLAVCALWVGSGKLLDLLVYMALLGGVVTFLLIAGRPIAVWAQSKWRPEKMLPAVLLPGEPVPYGTGIAGAMLYLIWAGEIPGLPI